MGISDLIASFLQESLEEAENGVLEVQRSDLAQRFNCVPSQINYVTVSYTHLDVYKRQVFTVRWPAAKGGDAV